MSETSLLVLVEAGQIRSLVGLAFQIPLPDALIWGPAVLSRIETIGEQTDTWPTDPQLAGAVVIDRDTRRMFRAGASHTFDTPYQSVLFDRMLASVWGYHVEAIELRGEAIAGAAGIALPNTDPTLAQRMMQGTMQQYASDEQQHEFEYDEEDFDETGGEDFRQLTTSSGDHQRDAIMRDVEDQDWLVSIRAGPREPYQHFRGDFVMQTFSGAGPEVINQLTSLSQIEMPKEHRALRGVVVDIASQTLSLWSHPRGVTMWDELDRAWPQWTINRWCSNGYRRHLELTGEAERMIVPSDLEALSGFVPALAEQLDLKEMFGQLKSGVRGCVFRAFGCLGIVLAIPASIAWLVTGAWQGPFAFAGTLWAIAFVGYLVFAHKVKTNFSSIAEKTGQAEAMMPKLAPEEKSERERIVNQALLAAGFPDLQQVQACAERYDEEDDDDHTIDPIVSA